MASIFMSYDSAKQGPVNGEATIAGPIPKDPASGAWIELKSCTFSGQPFNTQGQRTDVAVNTVRITKEADGATVGLLQDALFGTPDGTACIVFVRTGEAEAQEYLRLELKHVGIVSFGVTGGSDRPVESYEIYVGDFTIVTWTFEGQVRGAQSVTNILNKA